MRKYEWQREASDYNKGGDEAAEVDGSRALARVGGEIITPAMREERVGKRSDYEGQCCSRAVPCRQMEKEGQESGGSQRRITNRLGGATSLTRERKKG